MWKTEIKKLENEQKTDIEKINILYLEDDKIDVQSLERCVSQEKLPYNLTIASSIKDAKSLLKEKKFDVVLLDYMLPDGTGLDLLTFIDKEIPVIFTTGTGSEEIAVKAIKGGADDYLIKDPERNYLKVLPITIESTLTKKELELAQKRLTEELKKSNEELQHLAYLASHDLQEPLRMISSYAQLLEKRYSEKLDKDAKEFIGFMISGVNNMKALIDDLLEYSRVESKKKEFEEIDCNEIIKEVLHTIAIKVNHNNSKIKYDNLPKIQGDKLQIAQLFQNLILNSIKYRSKSPPEICISSSVKNDEWLFSVKDNGIGIAKEHQERIFKMFQRLHTKSEYEGTGIGLAICKKIVERHRGKIWVESEDGKGSTFYFTIPQYVYTGGGGVFRR